MDLLHIGYTFIAIREEEVGGFKGKSTELIVSPFHGGPASFPKNFGTPFPIEVKSELRGAHGVLSWGLEIAELGTALPDPCSSSPMYLPELGLNYMK